MNQTLMIVYTVVDDLERVDFGAFLEYVDGRRGHRAYY